MSYKSYLDLITEPNMRFAQINQTPHYPVRRAIWSRAPLPHYHKRTFTENNLTDSHYREVEHSPCYFIYAFGQAQCGSWEIWNYDGVTLLNNGAGNSVL